MAHYDCPLHDDVKVDIAAINSELREIRDRLSILKCAEYNVRMSKLEEDIAMMKREINEINKERYTARGVILLLAALGSMIGSLIIHYVRH